MELPHPFHCAAATRSASLLRLSKHKHTQLATEAVESMDEDGSLAASSFEVALIPGSGGSRGPPRSRQSIISHPTLTPPNFTTHFGGLAFNLQRNEPSAALSYRTSYSFHRLAVLVLQSNWALRPPVLLSVASLDDSGLTAEKGKNNIIYCI